jgi:hypothetical protein
LVVRKIAEPRASGNAMRRAIALVTTVPTTNGTTPKIGGVLVGLQTVPQRNENPKAWNE